MEPAPLAITAAAATKPEDSTRGPQYQEEPDLIDMSTNPDDPDTSDLAARMQYTSLGAPSTNGGNVGQPTMPTSTPAPAVVLATKPMRTGISETENSVESLDTNQRSSVAIEAQQQASYPHYTYAANGRLRYPPSYHCWKCNNTGYKLENGHPCRSCFEQFSIPQSQNVHVLPPQRYSYGYSPYAGYAAPPIVNGVRPRVVQPGDPSIGGMLCGACKGRGYVDDTGLGATFGSFLGATSTCSVCKGVGRLL
ncbi:uncharacterized protein V1518DRAFT_416145 [Limtongia smithiae]|uniref:uncharacterized protein n=1 Tax=Limtongia smithiae TaxID=1125753 RepID=UPI0034CE6DF2